METLPITAMRMGERILAVIIGGLTVYFGYRLFTLLPMQNDHAGNIKLPGFSVVLSKVGPGVFFVAFGTLILWKALAPVKIGPNDGFLGGVEPGPPPPATATSAPTAPTDQQVERVRHALQMLNCVERTVLPSKLGLRGDELEEAMRDAKVALIESVWNAKAWEDKAALRTWAQTRTGAIPSQVRTLYDATLPDCPR